MTDVASLLPPNSTALERALEQAMARVAGVSEPVEQLWNPQTCPAELLPFLGWGLSIDFWDPEWNEQQRRDAIADALQSQMRKGTLASLRTVIDRYDPAIDIIEWQNSAGSLAPYTFLLALPLAAETQNAISQDAIDALLADIDRVKPVRAHFDAVFRLLSHAQVGLFGLGRLAGFVRNESTIDQAAADDPVWLTYIQTEDGEPIELEQGGYWENE